MSHKDDYVIENGVLVKYTGSGSDPVIPDGVTEICTGAFLDCTLGQVQLPKSVRRIHSGAFGSVDCITLYDTIDPEAPDCQDCVNLQSGDSVGSIGGMCRNPDFPDFWCDHDVVVKSADTDEVKYRVRMGQAIGSERYVHLLTSGWGRGGSFAFDVLDSLFPELVGVRLRCRIAFNRLLYPVDLTAETRAMYAEYLRSNAEHAVTRALQQADMEKLTLCAEIGAIHSDNIDGFLAFTIDNGMPEMSAWLLELTNKAS